MNIGYSDLIGMLAGCSLDLIQPAYLPIVAIYGLTIMMISYHGYCIFHDACLNREWSLGKALRRNFGMAAFRVTLVLTGGRRGGDDIWIDGALALVYLAEAVMLLLREQTLRIQTRRAAKDEWDG